MAELFNASEVKALMEAGRVLVDVDVDVVVGASGVGVTLDAG